MKKEDTQKWDEFVEYSENGTIFHLQKFLKYHPKNRFKDYHLMFIMNNKLVAVIPGTEKENNGKTFISHPGASFSGIAIKNDISINQIGFIIKSLINHLKENNFTKIIINQAPLPFMNKLYESIDFSYYSNGFKSVKKEISSIIFLDFKNKGDIINSLKPSTKRSVKKALKFGVFNKETKKVEAFYNILKVNLNSVYHVQPTHSLKELKSLLKSFPERIKLFGTFLENKLVGGVVVFLCNKNSALIFYNAIDRKYQHYRPANSQIYHTMEWLWEKNYKYLDLGISSVNMKPNPGLIKFKLGFGSHHFVRNQYLLL
ncbi:GNAT family N-acetyltransferase [candidate division KSB1 bacterium]